jgi:hypothetical protein
MTFMDKTINVDANAGIFVTLNPAGGSSSSFEAGLL